MEIIKADIMGYCMGVRRAVESAEQSIKDFPHKNIYTLGPLIHNQNALDNLEQKGVRVLKLQNDNYLWCCQKVVAPAGFFRIYITG